MVKVVERVGLIIPSELESAYQKAKSSLENSTHSHGLNLKKMQHGKMYRVKIGYGPRAILLRTDFGWETIDFISLKHKYYQSAYVRGDVSTTPPPRLKSAETSPQLVPSTPVPFSEQEDDPLEELHFYGDTLIHLNAEQQQGLDGTLPQIITGDAGSGKTSTAYLCALHIAEQLDEAGAPPEEIVIYIAENSRGVDAFMRLVAQYPQASVRIQAKTYESWLHGLPELQEKVGVSKQHLFKFLEITLRIEEKISQALFGRVDELIIDKLVQQYRLFARHPFESGEKLPTLGAGQWLFKETKQQQWIWQQYGKYLDLLSKKSSVDSRFYVASTSSSAVVIADEIQSFTAAEILSLITFSKKNHQGVPQILVCGDARQGLDDPYSIIPFVKNKLQITPLHLKTGYRNPKQVTAMAQRLLQLKIDIQEGTQEKEESQFLESGDKPGEVFWLATLAGAIYDNIRALAQDTHLVVIISRQIDDEKHKKYVQQVSALYGHTPLVLTIDELKGCEFEHVVLHEFLDTAIITNIQQRIKTKTTASSSTSRMQRAFIGDGREAEILQLQALYTAITRTHTNLYIVQSGKTSALHWFKSRLQGESPLSASNRVVIPEINDAQRQEAWEKMRQDQAALGNESIARRIVQHKLVAKALLDKKTTNPQSKEKSMKNQTKSVLKKDDLCKELLYVEEFKKHTKTYPHFYEIELPTVLKSNRVRTRFFGYGLGMEESIFEFIIKDPVRLHGLFYYLNQHQGIQEQVIAHWLTADSSETKESEALRQFLYLCCLENGVTILKLLLESDEHGVLAKRFPPSLQVLWKDSNCLHWLETPNAVSDYVCSTISTQLEENPNFKHEMHRILYLLSADPTNQALVFSLIQDNQRFRQMLTPHMLMRQVGSNPLNFIFCFLGKNPKKESVLVSCLVQLFLETPTFLPELLDLFTGKVVIYMDNSKFSDAAKQSFLSVFMSLRVIVEAARRQAFEESSSVVGMSIFSGTTMELNSEVTTENKPVTTLV